MSSMSCQICVTFSRWNDETTEHYYSYATRQVYGARPLSTRACKYECKISVISGLRENYTNHNLAPRVHANIQVLEQFYVSKLSFAASNSFIACSNPSCFCCLLYFFVEPTSDQKLFWASDHLILKLSLTSPARMTERYLQIDDPRRLEGGPTADR